MPIGRSLLSLAALFLAFTGGDSFARGDSKDELPPAAKAKKANAKEAKEKVKLQDVSAAQQKQARDFATAQHPALSELLDRLEETNSREYERAIREIFRASEKLRLMADRNPRRHTLEVSLWKIESQIRLALAQSAMEGDSDGEDRLMPLMAERRDLKRQILELERQQATERIAEIDRQLETLQKDPEADAARELKRLRQTAVGQVKPGKTKAKRKAARGQD